MQLERVACDCAGPALIWVKKLRTIRTRSNAMSANRFGNAKEKSGA